MSALSAAEPDKTYTERLIDDALEQGDIQKATDLGKQGLKSTTSALATAGLLATGAGAFGALPADIVNTSFGLHGLYNAASKNGIRKTIRLTKEHNIPGAIQSGLGDALDLTMGLNTLRLGTRLGKALIRGSSLGNAYRSDVAGRELANNISKTVIPESDITKNILAGKIGWGPSTSNTLWHNSDKPLTELKVDYPAWDVTERNAPLGHVWLSDRETTSGFLAKRPYHLKSKVTLNKPMIQVGEAIGDGKNATRNEILDFAQKSNADALQFKNIADNQLTGQNISAVFKDVALQPKLSEAEKLGIPKDLQSNPKALEDPYYWGYQQWNQRYNTAVESGNVEEAQRLRDLHFKNKTPNNKIIDYTGNPHKVYHGSPEDWYIFDDSKRGVDDVIYFSTDKAYADQYTIPRNQWQKGMIPTRSSRVFYLYGKEPINVGSDMYYGSVQDELIHNWANDLNADSVYGLDAITNPLNPSSGIEFGVLRRNQFKLSNPITKTNAGEIIPIVKRDNFHNPDIRYKQGGTL